MSEQSTLISISISINIIEASLDFTLFLHYIFECNTETGPQIFNLFTNSVGMDNKAETLKFSATSFTGVLSNAGMIFCAIPYAASSPHTSKLQESCLFVQMSLFLLLGDHESRISYCFSKRQLVFLLQFLFSYLSLIHKRFCTNVTFNNCLRLLCTIKNNSVM